MGHHLCFHNLSPWTCFGWKKPQAAVAGQWESPEQGEPLDFGDRAASAGLGCPARAPWALLGAVGCLQRCLRGWDAAGSTASCLGMQPSWQPPEAELSWLAPAPSCPTTPEDAACQDAGGHPWEGGQALCTCCCWEWCHHAGHGGSHRLGGSSAREAAEMACHCRGHSATPSPECQEDH